MFDQLGRVDIYHIPGVCIIRIHLGMFLSHLHVCIGFEFWLAEEESGRVFSGYHYYSQNTQYGKNKEYSEKVESTEMR